ncbi:histidine phosphatase family protein [Metabacillus idriensis]|uniref:histidine phosphatase family protein n=1 Tax=Metabacillus idriensis TaxID=324768 RepID=UPI00174D48E7|nr:histidine phosphatase family protein [Metabacillus idriensis]
MTKIIYAVRHCQANGQAFDDELTNEGLIQAQNLAEFFKGLEMDKIISSPFLRAIQTAAPLAEKKNIELNLDERLSERVMSGKNMEDWKDRLKDTFDDLSLAFEGGESNQSGMERVHSLLAEITASKENHTVLVSHGNLITLLLRSFDDTYGYDHLMIMTNPDVYKITLKQAGEADIQRIWS